MTLSSTRGIQVGASGGSLNVASGTVLSYAGAATGTGTLTKKGLGTYAVSGGTALSGGLNIQQGAVQDVEVTRREAARSDGVIMTIGPVKEGVMTDDQTFDFAGWTKMMEMALAEV